MGVMTSYASYNPVKKPIIMDSFLVSLGNSFFSFIAGFAVFSTIGYLKSEDKLDPNSTASIGLAFISYPTAITMLSGKNVWAFVLAFTLFCLGIDSAFSMIEATSTVIYDTEWGKATPRKLVALVLCVIGLGMSTIFCSNWGFTYLDVVDHYLSAYLMLLLGIFQCLAAGWVFEFDESCERIRPSSLYTMTIGYWILTLLMTITPFITSGWILIPVFWVLLLIVLIVSFCMSGASFGEWYRYALLGGVGKICKAVCRLSYSEGKDSAWWDGIFTFWWGFSIKFFCPWAIYTLLVLGTNADLTKFYGDYHLNW